MKVEPINYSSGDTRFAGALVYDETVTRQRPAILMAPNWMGVRQHPTQWRSPVRVARASRARTWILER